MISINSITHAQSIIDHIGIRNPKALVAKFIGHGIGFRPEIKHADEPAFEAPPGADRTTRDGNRIYMRAYREYRKRIGHPVHVAPFHHD